MYSAPPPSFLLGVACIQKGQSLLRMRTISPLKFESLNCFIRRLRLCCKVGIMESIPEDLVSLKRNALQKLCKKLGLKANGKVTGVLSS